MICPLWAWPILVIEAAAQVLVDTDADPTELIGILDAITDDPELEDDDREEEIEECWFEPESYNSNIPVYDLCRCCGHLERNGWTQ